MRGIIKNYKEAKVENKELRELLSKGRGAKNLLPYELDDKVLQMIKNMTQAGSAVNYNIAIYKETALAKDRTLLKENCGSLNLDFSWRQSFFQRLGFTKRRAATAKKNEKLLPIVNSADYHQVTGTFSITPSGIFFPCK